MPQAVRASLQRTIFCLSDGNTTIANAGHRSSDCRAAMGRSWRPLILGPFWLFTLGSPHQLLHFFLEFAWGVAATTKPQPGRSLYTVLYKRAKLNTFRSSAQPTTELRCDQGITFLKLSAEDRLGGTANVLSLRVHWYLESSLELCLDALLGDGHEICSTEDFADFSQDSVIRWHVR